MRSIPIALAWEATKHCGWRLLFGFCYICVITFGARFLLAFVHQHGTNDPKFFETICDYILPFAALMTAGVVVRGQSSILSLSTFPIRTSTLVWWRMLISSVAVCLTISLFILFCNLLVPNKFTFWGPLLFSIAVVNSYQGVFWFTERSPSQPLAFILYLCLLIGWWYRRLSMPGVIAFEPAFLDLLVTVLIVLMSYYVGVLGVSRNRCGEPLKLYGLKLLYRNISLGGFRVASESKFRSFKEAQSWYDWQLMGRNMPTIVIKCQLIWIIVWLIANRNHQDLVDGYFFGGFFLVPVGFMGGALRNDLEAMRQQYRMGQFQASMPISNKDMGNSLLKTLAKSVLISWALWAGALSLVIAVRALFGSTTAIPQEIEWWYLPVTLIGLWSSTAIVGSLVSSGYQKHLAIAFAGIMGPFFAIFPFAILCSFSEEVLEVVFCSVAIIEGIMIAAVTCAAFALAVKMNFVTVRAAALCALCWLFIAAIPLWTQTPLFVPFMIFYIGLTTLVVFPIAMAPIAFGWNRSR